MSGTSTDGSVSGLAALAEVLAHTDDGIALIDGDGRCVYANAATCRMLGRPIDALQGHHVLDFFAEAERAWVRGRLPARFGDSRPPFFCLLRDADGFEREIVCATFAFDTSLDACFILIFRELTGRGVADRTAAALAQAGSLLGTGTTEEILSGIARVAVENSRAVACGFVVVGDDHQLSAGGSHGFPASDVSRRVWTADAITLEDIPGAAPVLQNRVVVLPDARARWDASAVMTGFAATLSGMDWQTAILLPVAWDGGVHGVMAAYLGSAAPAPSDADLALYRALADQAGVIVANARLVASLERTRLARELHDSVSQALFSMTMHARAAQLSLIKAGIAEDGPLGRSVRQLAELTKGALAEMRALIFELRPQTLEEEGLVAALNKHADALGAREQLKVTVRGPHTRLRVSSVVQEHLYRIAVEALHNVVKHADADSATVTVTDDDDRLEVIIGDDGVGFDPRDVPPGHWGLSTMAQRAALIGADFSAVSTAQGGTTIRVSLARRPPTVGPSPE